MSCALCGRLSRVFKAGAPVGAPDLIQANIGVSYSLEGVREDEKDHFTAWWDTHAFGAWMANLAARNGRKGKYANDEVVKNINLYKASNGEEIHGYLWQSLRLHAHNGGTLEGARIANPPHKTAVDHAHETCKPMWWLSPQTMNDCAHAAGHVRHMPCLGSSIRIVVQILDRGHTEATHPTCLHVHHSMQLSYCL